MIFRSTDRLVIRNSGIATAQMLAGEIEEPAASFTYTTTGAATATIQRVYVASEVQIDWGDGSARTIFSTNQANITHNYAGAGTYTVNFYGAWAAITQFHWYSDTKLSGNISAATWPTGLQYLYLQSTSVSGNISAATWPTGLQFLFLYSTSVSGDISAVTWPTGLQQLRLQSTSVSGDISAATWPTGLQQLWLYSTSVSGDISAATWPTGLQFLYLYSTSVGHAGGSGLGAAVGMQDLRLQNCALTQTEVDNVLADLDAARAGFTYTAPIANVSGTNAAPSGIYQYAVTPSTGKEYEYRLENDADGEGFKKWVITT